MFHGLQCIMGASPVNYTCDKPRNLESKRYWRFNAEPYDNVLQNTES